MASFRLPKGLPVGCCSQQCEQALVCQKEATVIVLAEVKEAAGLQNFARCREICQACNERECSRELGHRGLHLCSSCQHSVSSVSLTALPTTPTTLEVTTEQNFARCPGTCQNCGRGRDRTLGMRAHVFVPDVKVLSFFMNISCGAKCPTCGVGECYLESGHDGDCSYGCSC